jgi:hypothetical protein
MENLELKVSLGCIARLCLKNKKTHIYMPPTSCTFDFMSNIMYRTLVITNFQMTYLTPVLWKIGKGVEQLTSIRN